MVPTLSQIAGVPGALYRRIERDLGGRYYEWYFDRHPDHRALDASRAREAVANADHVNFLCLGNICRSPFAERYARHVFPGDEMTIDSAGLSPFENRPSPPPAIDMAQTFEVELESHVSRRADTNALARSDLIFVMDHANYYLLSSRFPAAIDRTYFLAPLTRSDTIAIPDPHGAERDTFATTYETIVTAIDQLGEIADGD